MDLISNLLKENSTDLMASLTGSGFSERQASDFLPQAGKSLMALLEGNNGDMDADSIISKIDISALAAKVGIDSPMAETGLKQILPVLLGKLGAGDLGDLMGKMKSLF